MDLSLEVSDNEDGALSLYLDARGLWVTCTDGGSEVTVGPIDNAVVDGWLSRDSGSVRVDLSELDAPSLKATQLRLETFPGAL